jgi:hypothetical protein
MKRIEHPTDRFWRKVEKGDGCWLWTGSTFQNGYGRFALEGKISVRSHRHAWELTNGPIPAGMIICHRCDNRICVNLDHLFVGTHKDNAEDRDRKRRAAWHRPGWRPASKLSLDQVAEVRLLRAAGTPVKEVAARFGIHKNSVTRITTSA